MLRGGVLCLGLLTSRSIAISIGSRGCFVDTALIARCTSAVGRTRRSSVVQSSAFTPVSSLSSKPSKPSPLLRTTTFITARSASRSSGSRIATASSSGIEEDVASIEEKEKSNKSKNMMLIEPSILARAWVDLILAVESDEPTNASSTNTIQQQQQNNRMMIQAAMTRALPLLEDVNSVPFVCRYRTDVIAPLTTRQVFLLHNLWTRHAGLEFLRNKVYQAMILGTTTSTTTTATSDKKSKQIVPLVGGATTALAAKTARIDPAILDIVLTSTSKSELEELYAPFKTPSKGSILDRIQKEQPALVTYVDDLWEKSCIQQSGSADRSASNSNGIDWKRLQPHYDAVVHLLSCKIVAEPNIYMICLQELRKHCRVSTSLVTTSSTSATSSKSSAQQWPQEEKNDIAKYQIYHDFGHLLMSLRDHQVLAIRRGVDAKVLQQTFDIDGDKMQGCIRYNLLQTVLSKNAPLLANKQKGPELLNAAIHDTWTRVLKRRGTTRLWKDKCQQAEERAMLVFEQNLHRALLAPPVRMPPTHVLALDPGFQAGIKCAVLDPNGKVLKLTTVKFLGQQQQQQRNDAVRLLGELLLLVRKAQDQDDKEGKKSTTTSTTSKSSVLVALGNGTGSQECRALIEEAADKLKNEDVRSEIQLVNEAGASVWSVTEAAQKEFPKEQPAALAAISIGRRLQNPLFELVKVPPRSLGLGMYQHDLSDKELDKKLHLTSVNAVATVGVDLHSCSLEILQKVPGLHLRLAQKVIEARPLLQKRQELLHISGLGPRAFENCAAFCRITGGPEPLDATLVHPESYRLARFLLKQLSWTLSEPPKDLPLRTEWNVKWASTISQASTRYGVSEARVIAVLENLVDSLSNVDPRLNDESIKTVVSATDSTLGCTPLPPELAENAKLQAACPVRGITGTIRNIADFGAFIDFGGHNDGLLHTSKLGPVLKLDSLLIGQQIGVDILGVVDNKVSLGQAGLNFQPDAARAVKTAAQGVGASDPKRRISSDAKRPAKKTKTKR